MQKNMILKTPSISIFIIILIAFVDSLGIGLIYPLFTFLLFDTSLTLVPFDSSPEYRGTILGILIALTPISQFFCSPLLGAFSDIKGRKKALIIGISIGCLGYLIGIMGIYFNSLALLFFYRILVGASDATAAVAQASLADISTKANKAKRFAYFNSSLGFGFSIGPFLGGIIADSDIVSWFNFTTPFILAGLLSVINLLLVIWKLPETRKKTNKITFDLIEGLHSIRKAFHLKHMQWLFFGGFALSFGWSFFAEFIPVLLYKRFDLDLSMMSEYLAFNSVWYAFGALAAAYFVHSLNPEKVAVITPVIVAACMLAYAFIEQYYYIWFLVPPMMCGLSFAFPTSTAILSNRTNEESQGEVLGIFQSVSAAAMGLSPLLAGSAIGAHPSLIAWGGALCFFLSGFAFWISNKQNTISMTATNIVIKPHD